MNKILIIDDEEKLRHLITRILVYEGYEMFGAPNCKTALKILEKTEIDVVVCDVKLPDGNGVELTKTIKDTYPSTEIIVLTAYGNIADGVQAIKNGAFDYITKGDDNNKIIPLISRAIEKNNLSKRVRLLEKQLGNAYSFDSIIGSSGNILKAIDLAKKVSANDTTVLLSGETGTGKEVFAQAIHHASQRKNNNFIAVNCSALSKDLLESELFGYVAGAFTGASRDKKGLFEEAHNGTLFLDEIGELAPDLQAKLLRVLETGEFIRVGGTKTQKVNARIIAATNRNLQQEVEAGNFREDLFYRISVFQIALPSLNDRISDIEELTYFFLKLFATKTKKKISSCSPEFISALKLHNWKGNIRELRNLIERCVILAEGNELNTGLLPFQKLNETRSLHGSAALEDFELSGAEKQHIQKVLLYANGNKTKAAGLE